MAVAVVVGVVVVVVVGVVVAVGVAVGVAVAVAVGVGVGVGMIRLRLKWKHAIREAHRQWAARLALGGAIVRCRYHDLHVPAPWNRRRVDYRGA